MSHMSLKSNQEDYTEVQAIIRQLPSLSLAEFNDRLNNPVFSEQLSTSVAVIVGSSEIKINSSSYPSLQLPDQCWSNNPNDPTIKMVIGVKEGCNGNEHTVKGLINQLEDSNKLEVVISIERKMLSSSSEIVVIEGSDVFCDRESEIIEKYPTIKFFYPKVKKISISLGKLGELDSFRHNFAPELVTEYDLKVTPECRELIDLGILDLEFSEYVKEVRIEFPVLEDQQFIGIRSLNAPNLKFLKIGNEYHQESGDFKTPILINRIEKMNIGSLQNFQLLNVTFNDDEQIPTTYDFSFLKHLERGSFSIHGDCKSVSVKLFDSFKDTLKVLEVFNCIDILQSVQSVKLYNLKFLLLEYCNEQDIESTDENVNEYFQSVNEMCLPSLTSISLKTIQIASLEDLKRLTQFKFAIKELTWIFEDFEQYSSKFNEQLSCLSEWLPNLKTLDLRTNCIDPDVSELKLSNFKLNVETFYYQNVNYSCGLVLTDFDTPNLLNLVIFHELYTMDIGDPGYEFANIKAPKLEHFEFSTDCPVVESFDLTKFPELKTFVFRGSMENEWKLGNDKLEICELNDIDAEIKIVGNLPALKKFVCTDNIKKQLEESNVDISKCQQSDPEAGYSAMLSCELEEELQKDVDFFFFNKYKSINYLNL